MAFLPAVVLTALIFLPGFVLTVLIFLTEPALVVLAFLPELLLTVLAFLPEFLQVQDVLDGTHSLELDPPQLINRFSGTSYVR
jgi:hypothetical protein